MDSDTEKEEKRLKKEHNDAAKILEKEEKLNDMNSLSKMQRIIAKIVNLLSAAFATMCLLVTSYYSFIVLKLYIINFNTLNKLGWASPCASLFEDNKDNLMIFAFFAIFNLIYIVCLSLLHKIKSISFRAILMIILVALATLCTELLYNISGIIITYLPRYING